MTSVSRSVTPAIVGDADRKLNSAVGKLLSSFSDQFVHHDHRQHGGRASHRSSPTLDRNDRVFDGGARIDHNVRSIGKTLFRAVGGGLVEIGARGNGDNGQGAFLCIECGVDA